MEKIKNYQDLIAIYKALGEETRLRIVCLLRNRELSVSDLTSLLHQSQPCISNHLKLLYEQGIVKRYQEGSYAYFRLTSDRQLIRLINAGLERLDFLYDPVLRDDVNHYRELMDVQAEKSITFFAEIAEKWNKIRILTIPAKQEEEFLYEKLKDVIVGNFIDLGTGTGRMLKIFSENYKNGVGIDWSHNMLNVARACLHQNQINHAYVCQGNIYNLTFDDFLADCVISHQVLHYLSTPHKVFKQVAQLLKPGGKFVIVDFAPHNSEFLLKNYAHQRLGFSDEIIQEWLSLNDFQLKETHSLVPDPDTAEKQKITLKIWVASWQIGKSII